MSQAQHKSALHVPASQVPAVSPASLAGPSSSSGVTLAALLRQGTPATASGYWEKPVASLEAAAAGAEDARFRALGALLVKDQVLAPWQQARLPRCAGRVRPGSLRPPPL